MAQIGKSVRSAIAVRRHRASAEAMAGLVQRQHHITCAGERDGKTLLDAIKSGASEGMQHFDGEIAQLVRDRIVDLETGLSYASNPTVLGQELAR